MKILIAPLAALAETKGPISRARALAQVGKARGHQVAFCAALDFNYKPVEDVPNYYAPLPSPMGTPLSIGKQIFRIAQLTGLQARKKVQSFEEVLYIIGAIHPRFFPRDVEALRTAIRKFRPDVVFSEFRPAAIVAARIEQVPVVTGLSVPAHWTYASSPKYGAGIRQFLIEYNLPSVESALEIFDWAELKFLASSYALEPMDGKNVIHVGPYIALSQPETTTAKRSNLIAYMGNGTVLPAVLKRTICDGFDSWDGQVYVASRQISPLDSGNIHITSEYDFNQLMPTAQVFINHGGQNSLMTGLVYGVPQVICPGSNFERQYNARSVENLQAGKLLDVKKFTPTGLRNSVEQLAGNPNYSENARKAGGGLLAMGGAVRIYEILESRFSSNTGQVV
jgi:uncharacterized protein (TIGR00661 family)